ncbi:hypothetical protein F4818DRAFT_424505 [Hypoxylon cercidicola]|nr:hypothetical protein F4818DRAFT_424505 [Hypoxylon cercidicola]
MEPNLQYVEDRVEDIEKSIFNVLKATLQYPTIPQAKAAKLAHDIVFLDETDGSGETLWDVWFLILDMAACIPPGHEWQDSLLQSLGILCKRDQPIAKHSGAPSWKELPSFRMCVREKWLDPAGTGEETEELLEEFSRWKNLNSFVARLPSHGFIPGINFPVWQLREALEEPPVEGRALECQIWVATEWIINCADILFDEMNSKEEPDKDTARAFRGGSLYDGRPPFSLERWAFWKTRFSELSANATSLGLDSATIARISDALKSMDSVKEIGSTT